MLQHIVFDLGVGCPILKFGHIHIFQRELNPNLFRVDLALGKQDNRLTVFPPDCFCFCFIYSDCLCVLMMIFNQKQPLNPTSSPVSFSSVIPFSHYWKGIPLLPVPVNLKLSEAFLHSYPREKCNSSEDTAVRYHDSDNWPQTCDDCGKHEPKRKWRSANAKLRET